MTKPRLRFVYAVDGGLVASVKDYLHKILAPATYPCQLCSLTYGALGTDPSWTCFVKTLPFEADFVHRDEHLAEHTTMRESLPAVFISRGSKHEVLLTADEINACKNLDALMTLIRARVEEAVAA